MARNPEILKIFEVADDSLQGLLGYYLYTNIAARWAPDEGFRITLPPERIPLTFEWDRFYNRDEMIWSMRQLFTPYHTRISLVAIVNIFEVATADFIKSLENSGHNQRIQGNIYHYKNRLNWVFDKVAGSTYGNQSMQARLPQLCLEVDHARRLRNISVHNNGLFDNKYETDSLPLTGYTSLIHPGYTEYKKDPSKPVTLILTPEDYLRFSRYHIELLHFLHHEIQRQDFGETTEYNYLQEKKRIEWHRVLLGF
ncbi:MAG: hypothetical protein Q8O10_09105 [candidate division Zixibacteria bacterium]|nr:hypothetical protein [candidate division Zixibacteria bacterium]